ncbi:hypothetical protein [Paenibacillus albidus]|nr:hypothetical protein [Paenibacillus albidus]
MPIPSQINNQSTVSNTSGIFSCSAFFQYHIHTGDTAADSRSKCCCCKKHYSEYIFNIDQNSSPRQMSWWLKAPQSIDAVIGGTITYSITVTNSGSVVIDGTPLPGANPANGIALGIKAPGASSLVTFGILVGAPPASESLSNQASVSFTSGAFSGVSYSNTFITPVYQLSINIVKSADMANATVGIWSLTS